MIFFCFIFNCAATKRIPTPCVTGKDNASGGDKNWFRNSLDSKADQYCIYLQYRPIYIYKILYISTV